METNLFIKSAKVDNNKISDINFYGDWEIDLGSGSGSGEGGEIQVGNGKPFVVDTQDAAVSINDVSTYTVAIKRMHKEINAGKPYYAISCKKYKFDYYTYYRTHSRYEAITSSSNYRIERYNGLLTDIESLIYMFFTEDGDYIKGYKFTGKYLQSLM